MLPVINAFKAAHKLSDVTVVADAGMISEANQIALQAAGLSFILGTRIPYLPDVVREWRSKHPDEAVPDGLVLTQPWPATNSEKARGIPDRVIYYQFRHDRARRTLRGIDEQVAKAQRAVDGHAPVKRNRYIQLSGATKSVNRQLEAKTRALAGWKGYTTNLTTQRRSSSSTRITSCGTSRRASGCLKLTDIVDSPGLPALGDLHERTAAATRSPSPVGDHPPRRGSNQQRGHKSPVLRISRQVYYGGYGATRSKASTGCGTYRGDRTIAPTPPMCQRSCEVSPS